MQDVRRGRRSLRLPAWDYRGAGWYFVTICTHRRGNVPATVSGQEVRPTPLGIVTAECWKAIPAHFEQVDLDEFVIMPDHVRGILVFEERAPESAALLGHVIGAFKAAVTRRVRRDFLADQKELWQRNYFEHVIRNDRELDVLREYILTNPIRWHLKRNS